MKNNLIFKVLWPAVVLCSACGDKNKKPEPENNYMEHIIGRYTGTDSSCDIRILKDWTGHFKRADTTIAVKEVTIIISRKDNDYFEVTPGNTFFPDAVPYAPDTCRLFSNLQGGSVERIIIFGPEKDHILIKDKTELERSLNLKPEENDIEVLLNQRFLSCKR